MEGQAIPEMEVKGGQEHPSTTTLAAEKTGGQEVVVISEKGIEILQKAQRNDTGFKDLDKLAAEVMGKDTNSSERPTLDENILKQYGRRNPLTEWHNVDMDVPQVAEVVKKALKDFPNLLAAVERLHQRRKEQQAISDRAVEEIQRIKEEALDEMRQGYVQTVDKPIEKASPAPTPPTPEITQTPQSTELERDEAAAETETVDSVTQKVNSIRLNLIPGFSDLPQEEQDRYTSMPYSESEPLINEKFAPQIVEKIVDVYSAGPTAWERMTADQRYNIIAAYRSGGKDNAIAVAHGMLADINAAEQSAAKIRFEEEQAKIKVEDDKKIAEAQKKLIEKRAAEDAKMAESQAKLDQKMKEMEEELEKQKAQRAKDQEEWFQRELAKLEEAKKIRGEKYQEDLEKLETRREAKKNEDQKDNPTP